MWVYIGKWATLVSKYYSLAIRGHLWPFSIVLWFSDIKYHEGSKSQKFNSYDFAKCFTTWTFFLLKKIHPQKPHINSFLSFERKDNDIVTPKCDLRDLSRYILDICSLFRFYHVKGNIIFMTNEKHVVLTECTVWKVLCLQWDLYSCYSRNVY